MSTNRVPNITKENDVTVITLGQEFENLDEPSLEEIRGVILDASKDADPPLVVLDLSHVKFFGSSFIEVLFRIWNRANAQDGGKFGICGLTPYCKEVLEITHLDELWGIYETRAEAIQDIASN